MYKCPFCFSEITLLNKFEFTCPVCRQLVGVTADGPSPRLVRAAADRRKPRVLPFFRAN